MAKKLKVEANKHLFEEFQKLGKSLEEDIHRLSRLGTIVQNDMTIDQDELDGWFENLDLARSNIKKKARALSRRLNLLAGDVEAYIERLNK